ncbi:alpha/beta hydrolase [Bailinhaonella thermotolerans]|uniref:Alpha/beta hydrolase n=1 Tax=Bailinhaonella thermotolerans TaxID=1070861 RepID=A0A3A4B7H4_9ACTN|nr:alpha/beta hydrolase [Bailinhaonella thermotolerans]RJL34181.1 alpha/beta hydrolase [Bailinhaonella thermotolerans]
MLRVLVIGVVAVVVLLGLLWAAQRRLIYLPDARPVPPAASVLPGARDVTLVTSDGLRLGAWHLPGGSRGITVLVAGGNAGNRLHRAPLAAALAREGFAVLLMDYRGYGGNPGSPDEEGLARDVLAARESLSGPVVYFGESLGAGPVTALARSRPPLALLLRSPFTSLADAGRHNYPFLPVGPLLRDRFPVAEHLASVCVPTAVVYGSRDTIVPPAMSRAVASAAAGPVDLVEVRDAGHNDRALLDGPELIAAVVRLAGTR